MNRIINEPQNPIATLILAHGAGAGMDSDFLNRFAVGISQLRIKVIRFEFPYMIKARQTNKKRAPNPMPILIDAFRKVIQETDTPTFIGGKSMGGRVASMIVDAEPCLGAICLGYPFHPIGKPDRLRTSHLQTLSKPLCILQGTRDLFGKKEEVCNYALSDKVNIHFLENGDHSFKTRKKDPQSTEQLMAEAIKISAHFIEKCCLTS